MFTVIVRLPWQPCVLEVTGPIDVTIGDKEIDANLRSVIVSVATVLPHLRAQPSACLINVSSGVTTHVYQKETSQPSTKAAGRAVTNMQSMRLVLSASRP